MVVHLLKISISLNNLSVSLALTLNPFSLVSSLAFTRSLDSFRFRIPFSNLHASFQLVVHHIHIDHSVLLFVFSSYSIRVSYNIVLHENKRNNRRGETVRIPLPRVVFSFPNRTITTTYLLPYLLKNPFLERK